MSHEIFKRAWSKDPEQRRASLEYVVFGVNEIGAQNAADILCILLSDSVPRNRMEAAEAAYTAMNEIVTNGANISKLEQILKKTSVVRNIMDKPSMRASGYEVRPDKISLLAFFALGNLERARKSKKGVRKWEQNAVLAGQKLLNRGNPLDNYFALRLSAQMSESIGSRPKALDFTIELLQRSMESDLIIACMESIVEGAERWGIGNEGEQSQYKAALQLIDERRKHSDSSVRRSATEYGRRLRRLLK